MPRPMVGGAGCIPPAPYFLIYAVLALARAAHPELSAFSTSKKNKPKERKEKKRTRDEDWKTKDLVL